MNGAGDLVTPPSHSEEIVRRIPGAEHVVVEDAGHIIMLEHPQLVTQQILMLIARAQRAVAEGVPVSSKPRVRRTVQDISKKRRVARARAGTERAGGRLVSGRRVVLPGVDDTRALGRALGSLLRAGDLVVLTGGLGAGKTTLTQGIGDGLGVRGPVTSPTFVIARVHPSTVGGPALVHVDAYRLGGAARARRPRPRRRRRRQRHRGRVGPRARRGPQRGPPRGRARRRHRHRGAHGDRRPASVGAGARDAADAGLVALGGVPCCPRDRHLDLRDRRRRAATGRRARGGRRRRRARAHRAAGAAASATPSPRPGRTPADLTAIAVGTGPGPFTGLRVGAGHRRSPWATRSASRCTASAASTRSPSRRWPRSTTASTRCSSPPTRGARRSTGRATAEVPTVPWR